MVVFDKIDEKDKKTTYTLNFDEEVKTVLHFKEEIVESSTLIDGILFYQLDIKIPNDGLIAGIKEMLTNADEILFHNYNYPLNFETMQTHYQQLFGVHVSKTKTLTKQAHFEKIQGFSLKEFQNEVLPGRSTAIEITRDKHGERLRAGDNVLIDFELVTVKITANANITFKHYFEFIACFKNICPYFFSTD